MQVSQSTGASAREQGACTVLGEIGHQGACFFIADERSDRHAELDIVSAAAMAIGAQALASGLGAMDASEAVVDECVDVAIGASPDASAAAAVAAVRAAARDVFLPAKAGRAVAALAGMHLDLGFVDELHGLEIKKPYR